MLMLSERYLNRCRALWGGFLLLGLSLPAQAHNGKTAYAIPLSNITIDGKLDDWPTEMAMYPIEWVSPNSYKPTPPDGPADLTASFRVGYDLSANLLYLAIVVQDEEVVVHPETPAYHNQDLCEVYVDGDHSGADRSGIVMGAREVAGAQQYMMVPGQGKAFPEVDGNPALVGGDIRTSGVRAALLRLGPITVYEWEIPLFESFPERRFQIEPGKTIGFDVVVADADGLENGNWVAWTPEGGKILNSDLQGDLAFLKDYHGVEVTLGPVVRADYSDLGTITGHVTDAKEGTPIGGVGIALYQADAVVQTASTDTTGSYSASLLQGIYTVKTSRRGVRENAAVEGVEVSGGKEASVDFRLEDLGTGFFVDDDALEQGDGSAERPFRTIQEALDVTSDGDTVRAKAGVYREPVVLVSGVTLLGAGPGSTFLDGEGKRGVVRISNVQQVVLEGFAIVGGQGRASPSATGEYQPPFGGILVENARHVRIGNNLISGNATSGDGGGILCALVDSTVVIAHNLIVGNTTRNSQWGGSAGGGGIYLGFLSRAEVHHNTLIYNEAAGDGGGILCEGASPYIHDNIIVHNLSGGLASRPVSFAPQETGPGPRLSHNDIWHNSEYDYSRLEPGAGDFSVDPEFLTPAQGDFRLSRSSPCRNAKIGAAIEPLLGGGMHAAMPPPQMLKRVQGLSFRPDVPVVRKIRDVSVVVPSPQKLRVDTVQVEVHPLDLSLLDRTEKLYERSSGVPSYSVQMVAPAPDGSIWVGTYDRGAARYDGLWTYLDTLNGLPGNQVQAILPTQDGSVWIATNSGLTRYRNGQATTVSKEGFRNLIEAPGGGLWLAGDQPAYLDSVWTYFSFVGDTGQSYQQSFPVLTEKTGAVWFVSIIDLGPTSSSPLALRYASSGVEAYELPASNYGLDLSINFTRADEGRLWIGLQEMKVIGGNTYSSVARNIGLLDPTTSRLQIYRLPEEWNGYRIFRDPEGTTWVSGSRFSGSDPQTFLLQFDGQRWSGTKTEFAFVALDPDGNFWSTSGRGIVRYGPQTWTTYKGEERLEGKRVTCIAEDRSGNLWFGSTDGLSRRNADGSWTSLTVADTLVTDLLVDRQGQLWAATSRGVYRYDGRQWTRHAAPEGLPDAVVRWFVEGGVPVPSVTHLAEGADGRVWGAGGAKGLFWYEGEKWRNVPVSSWGHGEWTNLNFVSDLYADREARLWIATNGGLYVFDEGKVRDYFEVFYPERGVDLDRLFLLERPEQIRELLKAMLKDEVAMAWFLVKVRPGQFYGTTPDPSWSRVTQAYTQLVKEDAAFRNLWRQAVEEGYVVQNYGYQAETKPEWKALALLGAGPISAIFVDRGEDMWVAAGGGGLFARNDSGWTPYEASARPFEGWVSATATDHQGNLWLATDQGAVRYDGQHWTTFDAADGLADNQVNDILEDHEGNIWFATAKGVTRYRPDTRPPQTRMVRGPEGTVGYGTSVLTFEFEGGDWEWEQRGLVFSHALVKGDREVQEGDWSEWNEGRFLQVPPPGDGHFTFYVRARDKALNVDPTPDQHAFYMAPPLWKALWFQASVGFGLLLIVSTSTYAVRNRRQARQVEQRLFAEMEKELQTAHDMQMALMPKEAPKIAGLDLAGRCLPANHVGGDLFQYFQQDGTLSLALADVTGHAMEAAIPVVMFSGVLDAHMETGSSVEELFAHLNRSLHRNRSGHTFVCFALGELDLSTRMFRLSSAGCPYPYHYRASGGEVGELRVDAYPLGVRSDTAYQVIEVRLEPGDRVVFCSDGIIEAANLSAEMFGFERTAETVRTGCRADLSPEALLERILQEVASFTGAAPQGDDRTIVVMQIADSRPLP